MDLKYDFSGWATRNDLVCSDGRTIRKDAFKHCDGRSVPLVWEHQRNSPDNILGHVILEHRDDGVYAYGFFNETESGQAAKALVQHGDIRSLSIYANGLKQNSRKDVMHGDIREVSLVTAGANPGAFIDFVDLAHSEGFEEEAIIGFDEGISLYHSDEKPALPPKVSPKTPVKVSEEASKSEDKPSEDETVQDVVDSMTEKQRTVMYSIIGAIAEELQSSGKRGDDDDKSDKTEGGDKSMKHNVFEKDETRDTVLSHSDQQGIIALAKQNGVGTLRTAIGMYMEAAAANGDDEFKHSMDALTHGIDNIESLFPDYKDLYPGAPELITRDQGWVTVVINGVNKTPISRIRTRQMDARNIRARGQGYQKGKMKKPAGNVNMVSRTTDPQTVYCVDSLHRDDIIDITDFDVVEYQYGMMKQNLNEEVAVAIMVGDGRDADDEMKISEEHIRSIWNDDDLYTIHHDVDIAAARNELQGSRTDMNFGDNFVYAEAIVTASMYAREKYKGSGRPDLFCTPHLVNVMLLARDMNGRRIYDTVNDLAAALNVGAIHTAEQFEDLVRVDADGNRHKLLGIFVNLKDYTVGSTKGGQITRFDQFDIDFNQHKYLIETRLSGALTRLYSAVALEEPVKTTTTAA